MINLQAGRESDLPESWWLSKATIATAAQTIFRHAEHAVTVGPLTGGSRQVRACGSKAGREVVRALLEREPKTTILGTFERSMATSIAGGVA